MWYWIRHCGEGAFLCGYSIQGYGHRARPGQLEMPTESEMKPLFSPSPLRVVID
jgi:hypothetical protein